MQKMVMIIYNEAIGLEVLEVLKTPTTTLNYTKVVGAYGKGTTSGTHEGSDIWPGLNNILYVACADDDAKKILVRVRELRKTLGREGVKAFILPIEDAT